jgi:hypothetical protein
MKEAHVEFIELPHQFLIKEGISLERQRELGITYDLIKEQIIIPFKLKIV